MEWKPTREIELVAGTPPGGGQDRPARALIEVLEQHRLLDRPVKLTNIVGRGGGDAWGYLRKNGGDPAEWQAELVKKYWANTFTASREEWTFLNQERSVMAAALDDLGLLPT